MEQVQIKDDRSRETSFNRPKKYKVLFHNDDFTTMEFVVEVLLTIFGKTKEQALDIMMTVHQSGQAEVGIYSYDVAMTKVEMTRNLARKEGFPLRVSCVQV